MDRAAPRAIASFGSASTATGRPSCSETSRATRGTREDPPTSSTADSWAGTSRAESIVRLSASTVSSTRGQINASNSLRRSRTDPCEAGVRTGIDTSHSLLSASLASAHSRRTAAMAESTAGSVSSRPSKASGSASQTWSNTASSKSTPPSRSPSGRPSRPKPWPSLWTTAASSVPPPRSYTAIVEPRSNRSAAAKCNAAACGSARKVTGTPCPASAPPIRSFAWDPHEARWVTVMRSA